MTTVWLESVVAIECSICDCRRRYNDRLTAICGNYRVQYS
eukprot:COSAG02_NODE_7951_length_2774_cov_1.891589_3_plen_40_part_00